MEKQIAFLKAAQLVEACRGDPMDKETVLTAIERLNNRCEQKLGKLADVVALTSIDHKKTKYCDRIRYCEDRRLSIAHTGTPFLALAVDAGSIPELDADHLQKWLTMCASFIKLERFPDPTRSQRKTQDQMIKLVQLMGKL